jgi:hypothetical protein
LPALGFFGPVVNPARISRIQARRAGGASFARQLQFRPLWPPWPLCDAFFLRLFLAPQPAQPPEQVFIPQPNSASVTSVRCFLLAPVSRTSVSPAAGTSFHPQPHSALRDLCAMPSSRACFSHPSQPSRRHKFSPPTPIRPL